MAARVLVLGGEGMLGHKMWQRLSQRFPDTYVTLFNDPTKRPLSDIDLFAGPRVIGQIDAREAARLYALFAELDPTVVVNCIGVIKQRPEAHDAIPSITLNSLLPHQLAHMGEQLRFRVIHFSTDCVFDGKRGGYTETDPSDAEDLYGKTKFLGEVATPNAVTLRTSIIGRELFAHTGLLDWFLSQRGKRVKGYRRVLYSGVTTNHLAEVVGDLIERHPQISGLYQVVSQTISKHDLLCLIRDAMSLNIEIQPDDEVVSDRSMKGDKFRKATGYVCPPWPELVAQLGNDPTPYDEWEKRHAVP